MLIFFEIWGTFSLAGIKQVFLVPSKRCVYKAYVMESDGLCQNFHLSHVNRLGPPQEHSCGDMTLKLELALLSGWSSLVQ